MTTCATADYGFVDTSANLCVEAKDCSNNKYGQTLDV